MISHVKSDILNAFNFLLRQHPFEKITVRMIMEEAHVSRATFYRYFKDKQEVLCYNWNRMFEHAIVGSHSFEDLFYYMAREFSLLGKRVGQELAGYLGDNNYLDYAVGKNIEFADQAVREYRCGSGMTGDEVFQCRIISAGIMHNLLPIALDCSEEMMRAHAALLNDMLPESLQEIRF